jgi:hypothetical protein
MEERRHRVIENKIGLLARSSIAEGPDKPFLASMLAASAFSTDFEPSNLSPADG